MKIDDWYWEIEGRRRQGTVGRVECKASGSMSKNMRL
jgi:hypothetical protein